MSRSGHTSRQSQADGLAGLNFRTPGMGADVGKHRIALAAFDPRRTLSCALVDLETEGLGCEQLGLAGRASVMQSLPFCPCFAAGDRSEFARLCHCVTPAGVRIGDETLMTSNGRFWSALSMFGATAAETPCAAPWMAPQLGTELAAHIAGGAVLLGVEARTASQQQRCTRILLTHSPYRVHTHEFRA